MIISPLPIEKAIIPMPG